MQKISFLSLIILALFFNACNLFKKTSKSPNIILDEIEITYNPLSKSYRASKERKTDLIHTKLEVRFDWEKSQLYGIATLSLRPYFYPSNKLILDAKGFDINSIKMIKGDSLIHLGYYYDSLTLDILLDQTYTRIDTYQIIIDYIAKPNEMKSGGSAAISSDKGLYFINPLGADSLKPKQIWTQGETEASSKWFPTIDAPNEKTTQEIFITVDDKYTTLSNGELIYSYFNPDETRTDYWKQSKPHAPYLFMMAIGEYEEIQDAWRDIEVNYYVEKKYKPYAKEIFGNTPEMLEFYSNCLGVDYPWDKYAQIVVRDYVSGAMENTSAVIHGSFLQETHRELLDKNHEDIIAHELFHHWFGDLVTCESWSNLPLNESFATYGEYLWIEYKYGKDAADYHLAQYMLAYKYDVNQEAKKLIRFYYADKEDMFDGHSYQKGGMVLHMLRNYVGDEAFFTSLKKYLTDNAYKPVEIHQLRLAFEEVSGKDLNPFFNQWFLSKGHPKLNVIYSYNKTDKKIKLQVQQTQDKDWPIFQFPVKVDFYLADTFFSQTLNIDSKDAIFEFKADTSLLLINFDADDVLLAEVKDNFPAAWSAFKYNNAKLYRDRYNALITIRQKITKSQADNHVIITALSDTFWHIRRLAIKSIYDQAFADTCIPILKNLLIHDNNSSVRAAALFALSKYGAFDSLKSLFINYLGDSSYIVSSEALEAIATKDLSMAVQYARDMSKEAHSSQMSTILDILSRKPDPQDQAFYIKAINSKNSAYGKYSVLVFYQIYLEKSADSIKLAGLNDLKTLVINNESKWVISTAKKIASILKESWGGELENLNKQLKKEAKDEIVLEAIHSKMEYYQNIIDSANAVIDYQ